MTDHPITPPLKLVQQWIEKYGNSEDPHWQTYECDIATQAARWGADQELEACLRLVEIEVCDGAYELSRYIRTVRRPKPPSLKEQALKALEEGDDSMPLRSLERGERFDTIRRALEQLDA